MFAEPLVAAALEAAAEDAATEEAAVEVLEEPPQAVIAAVAPTTADAFRKSRREIIFIIMFSFNSYLSIFTGAILHAPVIPVRIIPLQHPHCSREQVHKIEGVLLCYFNKCFLGSPISFLETSQFFIHLQPSYKGKKIMLFFSQKDYKMLHGLLWGRRVFLVYLEKYFQE